MAQIAIFRGGEIDRQESLDRGAYLKNIFSPKHSVRDFHTQDGDYFYHLGLPVNVDTYIPQIDLAFITLGGNARFDLQKFLNRHGVKVVAPSIFESGLIHNRSKLLTYLAKNGFTIPETVLVESSEINNNLGFNLRRVLNTPIYITKEKNRSSNPTKFILKYSDFNHLDLDGSEDHSVSEVVASNIFYVSFIRDFFNKDLFLGLPILSYAHRPNYNENHRGDYVPGLISEINNIELNKFIRNLTSIFQTVKFGGVEFSLDKLGKIKFLDLHPMPIESGHGYFNKSLSFAGIKPEVVYRELIDSLTRI